MSFNFYNNLISLYSLQSVQITKSVVHLQVSSIQKLFYSNNSSMSSVLHEPKSLSMEDSKPHHSTIKDNMSQKQEILRTTRKDLSSNRSNIDQHKSVCSNASPLFSNFAKYMQRVQVTYEQVRKRWQQQEEQFGQLLKEMVLQTEKQYQKRKVRQNMPADYLIEMKKEEGQDEMVVQKLKTEKKIQREIFNGYSNSVSIISYSDQMQQLLNAPRKQKKRSKIRKLSNNYEEEAELVKEKQFADGTEDRIKSNILRVGVDLLL